MCIRDSLQADCWGNKILWEGCDRTTWINKVLEQHTVSTLYKTSENLIVNGLSDGKQTSFTYDTCATVSVVRSDSVSYTHLDVYKRQMIYIATILYFMVDMLMTRF